MKQSDALSSLTERQNSGESLSDRAYAQIRSAIEDGVFIPGSRLRERDVASKLTMSRTPVREALRRLEAEGLLSSGPQGSLRVIEFDTQMIIELYQTREGLEGLAAKLAARHASETEVELMRQIIAEEIAVLELPSELARLNYVLHQTIVGAARNRFLVTMLNQMRDSMMLLKPLNLSNLKRAEATHEEHIAIVDAIASGDGALARQAAEDHIRNALNSRLSRRTGATGAVPDGPKSIMPGRHI